MKRIKKGLLIGLAILLLLSGCTSQPVLDKDDEKLSGVTVTASTGKGTGTGNTTSIPRTDKTGGISTQQETKNDASDGNQSIGGGNKNTASAHQNAASGNNHGGQPAGQKPVAGQKPADSNDTANKNVIMVAGTKNGWFGLDASVSDWNRQVCEQLSEIEKELGCTFQLKEYAPDQLAESCIKAGQAGTRIADIINADVFSQTKMARAGILWDLNAVQTIFSNKSYWIYRMGNHVTMAVFPVLYGVGGDAQVIYFNKALAKQAGTSDEALYQMVTDGSWTFSQMQALSQKALKDLDGNGIGYNNGTDQFGFTGLDFYHIGFSVFKNQGGYFTKFDNRGNITYRLGDAKNISALRTMQTWLLKDKSVFNSAKSSDGNSIVQNMVSDGRVLFVGGSLSDIDWFASRKQSWGILPYPKADKNSSYCTPILWEDEMEEGVGGFSIPNTVYGSRLDDAAEAVETIGARFYQIRQIGVYSPWRYTSDDARTDKMLEIIQSAVHMDDTDLMVDLEYGLGEGGMPTIRYLMNDVSNDPATRVNAVKEDAVAHLDGYLTGQ